VRFAQTRGTALPEGCLIDRDGNPSTNPDDLYGGGALVPMGGDVAGHKGYGLALASALLGGLAMIDDPRQSLIGASVLQGGEDRRGQIAGVFLIVIDPAAFGAAESYRRLVGETLAAAKRVPPARGREEVLVPGEPEERMRVRRVQQGLAIPEVTWRELLAIGERFGIAAPAPHRADDAL
jgi:LDH2 family malate/lactate/ureidoglycolate dehydrogenase